MFNDLRRAFSEVVIWEWCIYKQAVALLTPCFLKPACVVSEDYYERRRGTFQIQTNRDCHETVTQTWPTTLSFFLSPILTFPLSKKQMDLTFSTEALRTISNILHCSAWFALLHQTNEVWCLTQRNTLELFPFPSYIQTHFLKTTRFPKHQRNSLRSLVSPSCRVFILS